MKHLFLTCLFALFAAGCAPVPTLPPLPKINDVLPDSIGSKPTDKEVAIGLDAAKKNCEDQGMSILVVDTRSYKDRGVDGVYSGGLRYVCLPNIK